MKNVLTTREIEPTTIDEAETVCSPLFTCNIFYVLLFIYFVIYDFVPQFFVIIIISVFCCLWEGSIAIYHIIATIKRLIYFATGVPSLFIITASSPGNTANFGSSSL